jgi:hypothetical protein
MDLKDFITNSLCQIAEGIIEANARLKDTDAIINPTRMQTNSNNAQAYGRTVVADDNTHLSKTRVVEQ